MLQKLQAKWRNRRERSRQYKLDRALYRAAGHRGALGGGFDGGKLPTSGEDAASHMISPPPAGSL